MNLSDEIKRLEELHWRGALNDAEYAKAKDALMAKSAPPPLHSEAERLQREQGQNLANAVLGTASSAGIGIAIFGGCFGLIWTIAAISMSVGKPDFVQTSILDFAFPLFGVVFTAMFVVVGITAYRKTKDFQSAKIRGESPANPEA